MLTLGIGERDIADNLVGVCFECLERGKFGAIDGEYLISSASCGSAESIGDYRINKKASKIYQDLLIPSCSGIPDNAPYILFYSRYRRSNNESVGGVARFIAMGDWRSKMSNDLSMLFSLHFRHLTPSTDDPIQLVGYMNTQDLLNYVATVLPNFLSFFTAQISQMQLDANTKIVLITQRGYYEDN